MPVPGVRSEGEPMKPWQMVVLAVCLLASVASSSLYVRDYKERRDPQMYYANAETVCYGKTGPESVHIVFVKEEAEIFTECLDGTSTVQHITRKNNGSEALSR